jgi:uncharacterized protein YdhG (YjbR/CyaY superfamily)
MPAKKTNTERFTAEERAAMRERVRETKRQQSKAEGDADRAKAERIHEIVTAAAPQLTAKTWYGMPAYANDDDKIVCFFRNASKFKTRYATLGFSDKANLDDGSMWPTDYAIADLTEADEKRITDLVKKAVS